MVSLVEYLKIPATVAGIIIAIVFVMQIVGEVCEFKGKIVPWFMKIRKYFAKKRQDKLEMAQMLKDVRVLLNDVNAHYSADNIEKRDSWMKWVNDRAEIYDDSIEKLRQTISDVTMALKDNTKMTEEMFIQSSRDRIIDFATKVGDESVMVSREEFNRIFKVHNKYEKFLEERELTNGEIDINFQIIKESYENHLRNHTFIEDKRGYN